MCCDSAVNILQLLCKHVAIWHSAVNMMKSIVNVLQWCYNVLQYCCCQVNILLLCCNVTAAFVLFLCIRDENMLQLSELKFHFLSPLSIPNLFCPLSNVIHCTLSLSQGKSKPRCLWPCLENSSFDSHQALT